MKSRALHVRFAPNGGGITVVKVVTMVTKWDDRRHEFGIETAEIRNVQEHMQ